MNYLVLLCFCMLVVICSTAQIPTTPGPFGVRCGYDCMRMHGMDGPEDDLDGYHGHWRRRMQENGQGMGAGGKRRCPMLDMTPEERIRYFEESLSVLPPDSIRYARYARILENLKAAENI